MALRIAEKFHAGSRVVARDDGIVLVARLWVLPIRRRTALGENTWQPLEIDCANRGRCRVLVHASPIGLIGLVIHSVTPGTQPARDGF